MDSVRVYLDFVDPLSLLLRQRLPGSEVNRPRSGLVILPFEVCAPPAPLIDPESPVWLSRWARARTLDREGRLPKAAPGLVPWTRKAHELCEYARGRSRFDRVHSALFDAHLCRGVDIGRVDVLVGIARDAGMDVSETKAVLDVDRFTEGIRTVRDEATRLGVAEPATIVAADGSLIEPPWSDLDPHLALGSRP